MKRMSYLFTIIFCFTISDVFSQEHRALTFYRNQIGIQFNPCYNQQFFDLKNLSTVSALRYGYKITPNFTIGSELSNDFLIHLIPGERFHILSSRIGFFSKYSIPSGSKFQLFFEASPYYLHSVAKNDIQTIEYQHNKFGIYVAPGVSIYSKNRKINIDLYYKFSNLGFANGNKSVFSYKMNYNF